MKKTFIIIIILLLQAINTFAQVNIKKSNVVKKISDVKYYIHTVSQGETLYSICKAYDVSQKDIYKSNTNFSANLEVGQQITIPFTNKGKENEPTFYWHKVLPKQTVYAISKKYNVSVNDIYKHNPNAKSGIHPGEILKIPNFKKGGIDYADENYSYYIVEPGNTLFSISQEFGIEINQIERANPETRNGLTIGQTLRIPKLSYGMDERLPIHHDYSPNLSDLTYDPNYFEDNYTPCNSFKYNKNISFNIALMLPLFLEQNKNLTSTQKDGKSLMYKNSEIFLELYQGILIALYQLKTNGISINLRVYDTENSSIKVRQILRDPELKKTDLIIGPVYSSNVSLAASFAKTNKINIVSPLSQNLTLLNNNPFVFQTIPSKDIRIKKTSDFFSKLDDTSIVFVHNGTQEELKLIDIYKKKLVKSFSSNINVNFINIKTINYNEGGLENLEDVLSYGLENIIVIPSEEEGFITKIINKLNTFSDKYEIKLIGSPAWDLFQSLNIDLLQNMDFHYISPVYTDYENWKVKSFIKKYRKAYNTEPGIYSFEGYDIMYYFANALKQYGRHFQFCISPYDNFPGKSGIVFDFDFVRTGLYNGFQNNGTFILKYDKYYNLQKVIGNK